MAVSAQVTAINFAVSGMIYVTFEGGTQREFTSLQGLQEFAAACDDTLNTELAQQMAMRWWLERDPNAENVTLVLGKRLTFDMSTAEMIGVVDG